MQATKWENLFHQRKPCSGASVARPKKQPHNRVRKDTFSGPRYLLAAAKAAAGVHKGNEFSPWIVDAIMEKLQNDHRGLVDKVRDALQDFHAATGHELNESEANHLIDELVAAAISIELGGAAGGVAPGTGLPYPSRPRGTGPAKGKK